MTTHRTTRGVVAVITVLAVLLGAVAPAFAGSFSDVPPGAFYETPVETLVARGITTGSPAGSDTFKPLDPVTRGETVTFLYRYSGHPAGYPSSTVFTDVDAARFYGLPISWAYFTAITTGSPAGSTTFKPDDPVTRGEMVTFLWRCAGKPAVTTDHGFVDVPAGKFYETAVRWARATGITTGSPAGSNTFKPDDPTTRGEMAAFIQRLGDALSWQPCGSNFVSNLPDQPVLATLPGAPAAVAGKSVVRFINGADVDLDVLLAGPTPVDTAVAACVALATDGCGPYPPKPADDPAWCVTTPGVREVSEDVFVLDPGTYQVAITAPGAANVAPLVAEWLDLREGVVYEFCVLKRLAG